MIGRKLFKDGFNVRRMKYPFYKSKLRYSEFAKDLPPYESNLNYDAKVWEFVKKLGKDGDYIFNVK